MVNIFKKTKKISREYGIVFNNKKNYVTKESYIRLKDNILYSCLNGNKKVIQVESSVSNEAKTTTVANLAVSFGEDGKKVCIVDLDLRKPRSHRSFKIENKDGLSDYVLGKIDENTLIKKTTYKNVDLINSGSDVPNYSVVLTSDSLKNLFVKLRSQYDFIFVDCPPILILSDYIHISRLTDGVLFIVAFGRTKKTQVRESIKLLKNSNIELIGSAFTFYNPKKSNTHDSYYYYNYYGYDEKK